jgi:hypothetical protein
MSAPVVEIWQAGPSSWRWLYRDPAAGLVLLGNRSQPSAEAALESARRAYPDARVLVLDRENPLKPIRAAVRSGLAAFAITVVGGSLARLRHWACAP